MTNEAEKILQSLGELLDRERSYLLAGQIEELGDLLEKKEILLDAFAKQNVTSAPIYAEIQGRMKSNQSLLESAMAGIRSVELRIKELRDIRSGLDTYDRSGQRRRHPRSENNDFEKRA